MFADRYWQRMSIGPFSSDGDATNALGRMEGAAIVQQVDVYSTVAVATHATNYVTMSLVNLGTAGAGTTVIATASTSQTGGAAVAAHVPFPLTITAANAAVADGATLGFVRDEATTDADPLSACTVVVRYQSVGAP